MNVIETMKNILGYTGTELDWLFAIEGSLIVILFILLFYKFVLYGIGIRR